MSTDKWELIYNSWIKLFKKFGPKRVSIDAIVLEAWVSKGTFYNYYKNKEELYESIVYDIINHWKDYMRRLVSLYPDPKERLMVDLLNTLDFFCWNNGIIGALMSEDKDYFLWEINSGFLEKMHKEIIAILFSDIIGTVFKNDEDLLIFTWDLFWLYKHANVIRHHYESEDEYKDFMTKLAYFFVEWIFNDKLKNINDIKYNNYLEKLKPFKWAFNFMKKY